jgi:hypothetical protein
VGRPIEIERSSEVAASRAEVWAVVSTMAGVNDELRPLVRMTHPPDRSSLDAADEQVPFGEVLFASWLLAGGLVPFDRHALVLASVEPGVGFVEESTSWLQRRWRHERTLTDRPGGGCRVTDRLVVEPRVWAVRPLAAALVGRIFAHRHRRLVARFGAAAR